MNNYSIFSLLKKEEAKYIIDIFENEGAELRFVGGCVRNAILESKINDLDCAINIKPESIINILEKKNIKYDDFAKKYGSIKVFLENQKFEITSLRKDINQRGRDTDVIYTNDWEADAKRRDFTFNAIYLKSDGKIKDYFHGLNDLKNSRVKFIGDIKKRTYEDFLRLFRYYRFLGIFKIPQIISGYDETLSQYIEISLNNLSNDLIRQEILKMFNMPYAQNCFFIDFNSRKKKEWVKITHDYFIKKNYDLGIKKCLNKIDLLFN